MRRASCFLHVAGMALTWAVLGGAGASGQTIIVSDSPPPDKKKAATPKVPLPPKLEARLKELMDKARVEKDKVLEAKMKKEIEAIAQATGLNDAGQQALGKQAQQTAEACAEDWSTKLSDALRNQFALQPPEQAAMQFEQMEAQITMIAQMDFPIGSIQPTDQDDWIKALHATLSPTQAAAWDKVQTERRQEVEKQMGDILKSSIERTREQYQQEILPKCQDIELTLGLAKDRADKLEELAKKIADQATEKWQKQAEAMLLAMSETQRKQVTANGGFFFQPQPDDLPSRQTAWKEGMAHLLTADEMKRLQAIDDDRKNKRAHVMGQIMIMLLDEKIAFTAAQRQQLQPIADRLAKNVGNTAPDSGFGAFFSYSPGIFLAAAAKATETELKPILDTIQLKHWRLITGLDHATSPPPDDAKAKPEANLEPEDVERCISQFLYEKTADERDRLLADNLLKVEDVVRAAGLNSEAATRLQTATRGTTEQSLVRWKWFIEQQVRSQLQEVTPQNVQQRLDSIQDYFFQQNFGMEANGQSVWENTVKAVLTAKQQEAWQKETDARNAFHEQAIAALVMTEFDRRNPLSQAQWDKLQPLVAGIVHDYSPDISRIFSPSNPTAWYMEGFYVLMPFVGIPDKDLQAILTQAQWDRWSKSQERGNAGNLWSNIQQMHNQRVKTK